LSAKDKTSITTTTTKTTTTTTTPTINLLQELPGIVGKRYKLPGLY